MFKNIHAIKQSGRNFARAKTAELSWHVQIWDLVWSLYIKIKFVQKEFSRDFNIYLINCLWNGTPVTHICVRDLGCYCFRQWLTACPIPNSSHNDDVSLIRSYCPACRTTLIATRFRVAVICPIIQVPHCIRVFFYFVWFVFINHIFQFYYELCTYCNILDIYLS